MGLPGIVANAMAVDTAAEYTDLVAMGLTNLRVEGMTVYFDLVNGETQHITVPTPNDGVDGADGEDGIGISNVEVRNKRLIVTYTDGRETDAGPVGFITEGGGSVGVDSASDVPYSNTNFADVTDVNAALNKLFSKVYYISPAINSFSSNPAGGTREIGSKISSVTFNWTVNKDITEQSLTGCTVSATDRTATYNTEISSNKSFRLTIKDAEGSMTSKDISFSFYPKVYYGSKVLTDTIDSNYITGLSKGDLKSGRGGTYAITVASGQYGIIAFPKSFGTPSCKIGGFDTDLTSLGTVSVTNASGYTQDYNVYRTPNPSLGSISMVIS